MLPAVSVIIPVYNAELYVETAVMSVLRQSFDDFELLVIDDGSDDGSAAIIERLNDPRIQFFRKQNEGQCSTLNFGISKAKGRYIKFLDADDYLDEFHLEKMMEVLYRQDEDERSLTLVLSKWQRFSGQSDFWPIDERPEWCDCTPLEFIQKALGNGPDMLPGWQWLIPKAILNKAGGWNEELGLGNDFDFSIRIILAAKHIRFCKDAVVYYRSDLKRNMSSDTSIKTISSVLKAARTGISNILSVQNDAALRKVCADKLQIWLLSYYPYINRQLVKEVEFQVKQLGGSDANAGWDRKMLLLKKITGWKVAKMLQFYFYKFRY